MEIISIGGAGDPRQVVETAIQRKEQARKDRNRAPFIHVYCSFDRDSFDRERYQAAFDLTFAHNDVTAIWSNECFELWYLLHFEYRNTGMGRALISSRLSERLGFRYKKSDPVLFEAILSKQEAAIANAKRLLLAAQEANPATPWHENPSTNVQCLIDKLRELERL